MKAFQSHFLILPVMMGMIMGMMMPVIVFGLAFVMMMGESHALTAMPTKQEERAEALKLITLTCEKVPSIVSSFAALLEGAIAQSPLDVGLRDKLQLAKESGVSLAATCAQKPDLDKGENPEISGFFTKIKTSVDGTASVGNYLVLNFSTGTAADKPLTDTVENVNLLSKMLEDGAAFFASTYAQ
jgi:hypothetical protein